jgi:hypothetical protein
MWRARLLEGDAMGVVVEESGHLAVALTHRAPPARRTVFRSQPSSTPTSTTNASATVPMTVTIKATLLIAGRL